MRSAVRRERQTRVVSTFPKTTLVLMWTAVLECAVLMVWPQVSSGWILRPARELATMMQVPWAILVLVSFGAAVWLSVSRWHTHDRLRKFARFTAVPGWVLAMLGVPVGWALLPVTRDIRAMTRVPAQPEPPVHVLTGEPIDCLACGTSMPGSAPTCTACGWSFQAA